MANNQVPRDSDILLSAAEDGAIGAQQHQASIPLKANDAPAIEADRNAAQTALINLKIAETTVRTAYAVLDSADRDARAFLTNAKGSLVPVLGLRWTPLYSEAGFPANSMELPHTQPARFQMLGNLRDFLTRYPQYADARPAANVTAERATILYDAIQIARGAVNTAVESSARALESRDAALQKLRRRLSGLVAELRQNLGLTDEKWFAFGLTPPRNSTPPMAVDSGVTAQPGAPGMLILNWGGARRATRYAVYIQVEAVHGAMTRVASVRERSYVLTDLPSGKRVKIMVAGVNRTGEGPASEVLEVVIP